jgi:hypothetical protein
MRIDFSSTAATTVVAVVVSFTLWWQFRKLKQPANSVTAQPGGNNGKDTVHEISVKEEEHGQEQKWISKATITLHKAGEPDDDGKKDNTSCLSTTMTAPDSATVGSANSAAKKEEDEPNLKDLKNFKVEDIPDFTIELADSDDDMF